MEPVFDVVAGVAETRLAAAERVFDLAGVLSVRRPRWDPAFHVVPRVEELGRPQPNLGSTWSRVLELGWPRWNLRSPGRIRLLDLGRPRWNLRSTLLGGLAHNS